jgi:transketolase
MQDLKKIAAEIRIEALKALASLGFGHVGGAMSIADTLAVLYGAEMKIDPQNPAWEERDYLVLSKGHAGPALYAALALKGYFPVEELQTINRGGTRLPSHCDRNKTPGVDMSTGSLGQGMSSAIGIALGFKMDKKPNKVFLILGDGECDEGQVWEGALFAAQHKVSNLIAFVDYNRQQLDGYTKDICDLGDLGQKFDEFGWSVQEVPGHDTAAIQEAVQTAKKQTEKPNMIILNTQKGKGCTFAEGKLFNHHMTFTKEQAEEAVHALQASL